MSRLILISNLCRYVERTRLGHRGFASSGGLVTALAAYLERQRRKIRISISLWVGWPGGEISSELQERAKVCSPGSKPGPFSSRKRTATTSTTAFVTARYGRCSTTFSSYVDYAPEYWDTYVRINRVFCDAVSS
jgi:trehalose-6-phosphate synthase